MENNGYTPQPLDTASVELPQELLDLSEEIARNVHDVWAKNRIAEGWTWGPVRDDEKRQTPCLVPYEELPEEEEEPDELPEEEAPFFP